MKAHSITINYNSVKLPKWVESAVQKKAERTKLWAEECKQMRINKSTK